MVSVFGMDKNMVLILDGILDETLHTSQVLIQSIHLFIKLYTESHKSRTYIHIYIEIRKMSEKKKKNNPPNLPSPSINEKSLLSEKVLQIMKKGNEHGFEAGTLNLDFQ